MKGMPRHLVIGSLCLVLVFSPAATGPTTAASGTAATVLSAPRTGQGALYQAMFYPRRVDQLGNAVEWTGELKVFWMDQYGEIREDTVPYDSSTLPATIRQPFTGTSVSTPGLQQLKELDRKLDKVIKLSFDTTTKRTRAKTYEVSQFGRILSGKATKVDTTGVLWDSGASFPQMGVKSGFVVENVTKGTQATIDSPGQETVKATSIKASGIPRWDPGDEYLISQQGPDSPKELNELKPVWDGSLWLAEHGAKDRRIFTWVDLDGDGQVDGARGLFDLRVSGDEIMELAGSGSTSVAIGTGSGATSVLESSYVLETDSIAVTLRPYLGATSNLRAAQIINWIRGVDQPDSGLRQRTFLTPMSGSLRTLKLGDIVHSTPTVVGAPAENFDLIYKDSSYTEFYRKYGDRRNVVYVGANDGMLHAFNGGFYDRDGSIFYDNTGHVLGEELWAFIPYELLPHLEFLTKAEYGHVYYVDLKPKVFDARIFTPDSVHVNGWGTLLLVGMGMGGKEMTVDVNGSYEPAETSRSAYILFDVTDPLQPRFLGSYTDSNLGQTTSYPAVFRIKDKWFMAVGSGPNGTDAYAGVSAQQGYVYVVEIGASGFGPTVVRRAVPDTEITAFMGDPSVVDLDLRTATSGKYLGGINWSAEVIYLGSVYDADGSVGQPYQWRGRMYHIRLTSDASLTTPDDTGSSWAYQQLAESSPSLRVGPITAAANVARDDNGRRWVYFGTGRLFSSDDISNTDRQAFFGLKEPVDTSGSDVGKLTFGTVTIEASTDPKSTASLFDATSAKVYEGGAVDVDGNGSIDYAAAVAGGWNGFIQTLDSSKNGWVIQTSPGERILGTAAVLGGVVAFSSWQPPPDCTAFFDCLPDGASTLYSPFYKTGTAFTGSIIGLGNNTYSGNPEVLRQRSLGTGISSTPTIHVGETGKAFIQSSTGAVTDTEIKTVYPVKSGMRSWRLH